MLEMLVTLSLIGLIAVLAMPNMGKILDSVEFRKNLDSAAHEVSLLRVSALLKNQKITYPVRRDGELIEPAFLVEAGWDIEGGPITILKTGICLGGELTFIAPSGRSQTLIFDAPDCKLVQSGS